MHSDQKKFKTMYRKLLLNNFLWDLNFETLLSMLHNFILCIKITFHANNLFNEIFKKIFHTSPLIAPHKESNYISEDLDHSGKYHLKYFS